MKIKHFQPRNFRKFDYKIAVIKSTFNLEVTDKLLKGILDYVSKNGEMDNLVDVYDVPGAFEIPFLASKITKSDEYKGIIAIASIIRGETAHYKYLANSIFSSMSELSTRTTIPITMAVLVTYNTKQALDRIIPTNNKGLDAIEALHSMIEMNSNEEESKKNNKRIRIITKKNWQYNTGFKEKNGSNFIRL